MIPRHTSCRGKIDHSSLGIKTSSENEGGGGVKKHTPYFHTDNNEILYPKVITYEIKTCLKNRKIYFKGSLLFPVFLDNSKEMLLNTVSVINGSLWYILHYNVTLGAEMPSILS
jgi:hypothetical protein